MVAEEEEGVVAEAVVDRRDRGVRLTPKTGVTNAANGDTTPTSVTATTEGEGRLEVGWAVAPEVAVVLEVVAVALAAVMELVHQVGQEVEVVDAGAIVAVGVVVVVVAEVAVPGVAPSHVVAASLHNPGHPTRR